MAPRVDRPCSHRPPSISCWFRLPDFLPPKLSQAAVAGFEVHISPPAAARRGLRSMQGVVTNLRQQLHILQENWVSEHTDDFLASCAVAVSSLLPPFAKTVSAKAELCNLKAKSNENVPLANMISYWHREYSDA